MTDNYAEYMSGRIKYSRPQGMLWANNSGTLSVLESASITAVDPGTPASGSVKYTANNSFVAGDYVTISGIAPTTYNGRFVVTSATSTYFVVANTTTTTVTDATGSAGKSFYVPTGYEINSNTSAEKSFLILSDDNRGPLEFVQQRIENRVRTVNGRMRSYHIADKLQLQVSWEMLPSRSFSDDPNFSLSTGKPTPGSNTLVENSPKIPGNYLYQYTTDGGAGGAEILKWYEDNPGSFWVYLSYDKTSNFDNAGNKYGHLAEYSQVIEMFVSDFNYSVQKRGATNFDMWNISVTLEEV